MVSRRPRSVFAVLLAFALLPIASMARGGAEARAQTTAAWMQAQAKAQTLAPGVHTGFGELTKYHADATPFAPCEAFRLALSTTQADETASTQTIASASAPATLHPARAPPALS